MVSMVLSAANNCTSSSYLATALLQEGLCAKEPAWVGSSRFGQPLSQGSQPVLRSGLHPQLVLNLEASRASRVDGREQLSIPHPSPSESNTGIPSSGL